MNMEKQYIWRTTKTDGVLPFRNFGKYQEQDKVKETTLVQDINDPFLVLDKNLVYGRKMHQFDKESNQCYEIKSTVYSKELKSYVKIVTFDKETKKYGVKLAKEADGEEKEEEDLK